MSIPFYFEREIFHQLNQDSRPKDYQFKIGSKSFFLSKVQTALISLNALHHFEETNHPFIIQETSSISNQQLISCFISLVSLFSNQTDLTINEHNFDIFLFLAKILDNIPLLMKCFEYSDTPQIYSFSSKYLCFIPQFERKLFNDFQLNVNGEVFELNYSLLCCICNKFAQMKISSTEYSCQVSSEHLNCIIHFLKFFNGEPFHFQQYSFSSLSFLIDLFDVSYLLKFISNSIPLPQNISESIQ
jgi:hypothetical protein